MLFRVSPYNMLQLHKQLSPWPIVDFWSIIGQNVKEVSVPKEEGCKDLQQSFQSHRQYDKSGRGFSKKETEGGSFPSQVTRFWR